MEIVNHIKYDLAKRGVPPVIDAVQGENNARIIELSLFANGSAFDVSGSVCSLSFSKPDGKSGWYDTMPDGSSAYETNGNVLRMKIAPQVLAVHGDVTAVVRIESDETSDRTTTFPLIISVSEDPAINALASENYYSVQNWDTVNQLLPYAILYIKQELSEDAKKQARKNIDAVGNGETLDLKGKAINNVGLLTLAKVDEDGNASGGIVSIRNLDTYDENNNLKVLISELFGNSVSLVGLSPGSDKNSAVTKGQLEDAVDAMRQIFARFDEDVDRLYERFLIVTVKDGVSSKSGEEILTHIKNGGVAYLYTDGLYMPLSVENSFTYAFAYYVSADGFIDLYEIHGNEITRNRIEYATKQQIGDIETALDSIIAIQNELIGGDVQ